MGPVVSIWPGDEFLPFDEVENFFAELYELGWVDDSYQMSLPRCQRCSRRTIYDEQEGPRPVLCRSCREEEGKRRKEEGKRRLSESMKRHMRLR